MKVNVNSEQRFFKHKDVSLDELKYLLAKGYREIKCLNIEGKKEMYLIKPRPNEGQEHFFLTYNITEYLKSKNIPFQLFNSVKPDIVFTNNGKECAIEIETGKVYTKDKKKFKEKVRTLKENYGDNWFFVVTNRDIAPTYNKFGKTFTRKTFIKQFEKWCKRQ